MDIGQAEIRQVGHLALARIEQQQQMGLDGGGQTDSATFYMTSQYRWGWQPLEANSGSVTGTTTLSSLHDSPNGMIPAPNPEASTVALYLVGLMGMAGFTYLKQRGQN